MKRGDCRVALRGGKWRTFSRALHGRAQQATPLRRHRQSEREPRRKFQISDLKFEIGETATAKMTEEANADPSPLKGIRDGTGATDRHGENSTRSAERAH